jgi:D-alanyl-D-alanine carboxypeptidase/D-alanyl-D-alanine-endopeptidase (penicillin-binding protein 4)
MGRRFGAFEIQHDYAKRFGNGFAPDVSRSTAGKLFKVLPAVGQSGTLKSLMPKTDKPFIFAKSGSFSNNYNLSGYLVTKQGKVLCFSLMNNNFVKPMSEIRKEVVKILTEIYQY